jgi:serine/arginine repetitive matrix protein 2
MQNSMSATALSVNTDNTAKANTQQDSLHTVQNFSSQKEEPVTSRQRPDMSQSSRRNRDLAQALFGENSNGIPPAPTHPAPLPPQVSLRTAYHQPSPSTPTLLERSPTHVRSATEEPASAISPTSPPSPYPMQMTRNTSILRSPNALVNQTELAREVQRKTEAATASLKRGPSAKYYDTNASAISLSRKRITPHQISTPHLVSASTSMDTIPLRSPSVASSNIQPQKSAKLGQRIRRWGTLRTKPTMPTGEEITPFPLDAQSAYSSTAAQTARYTASNVSIPRPPASAGFAESSRPMAPLPSPPATAGPGLKGFMSRFRKPRTTDMSPERERRSIEQDRRPRPPISNPISETSTSPLNEYVFPRQRQPNQSQSAPADKPTFQSPASPRAIRPELLPSASFTGQPNVDPPQHPGQPEATANDNLALKQLFDAASNLGLDQTALNDLLARSGSTSSRSTTGWTMLTRNDSSVVRPETRNESAMDRARSPTTSDTRAGGFLERNEDTVVNNTIPRKRVPPLRARLEGEDGDAGANTIVRRTIIFPSELRTSTIDLNILMKKNSSSIRRHRPTSGSAGSVASSSRSVHDRAPTPPPPRSPTGRRFSHDTSPPVPQLPASFSSQAENMLPLATPRPTAAGPVEKSSSAYDSL